MIAAIMLMATATGVPIPSGNFPLPGADYRDGPLEHVMSELRGEHTKALHTRDESAVLKTIKLGRSVNVENTSSFLSSSASYSDAATGYLGQRDTGSIRPNFLWKYEACSHTRPNLFRATPDSTIARVIWSCGANPPYLTQTMVVLKNGLVTDWTSIPIRLIPLKPQAAH